MSRGAWGAMGDVIQRTYQMEWDGSGERDKKFKRKKKK